MCNSDSTLPTGNNTFIRNEYVQIVSICAVAVLTIVVYGTYRCKTTSFRDPFTVALAPDPLDKYLDGWGILHFFFFLFFGYFYPSKLVFAWVLGLIWELVEYAFKDRPFYISDCQYEIDTDHGVGWWYGRWQDIVMNSLGLLSGYALRLYMDNRNKSQLPSLKTYLEVAEGPHKTHVHHPSSFSSNHSSNFHPHSYSDFHPHSDSPHFTQ
jgi:hypothetical protein